MKRPEEMTIKELKEFTKKVVETYINNSTELWQKKAKRKQKA